jgi:hypothetical protein
MADPSENMGVRYNATTEKWEYTDVVPLTVWERLNADEEFREETEWQPFPLKDFTKNVIRGFKRLVDPLRAMGVEIQNVGRASNKLRTP